MTSTAVERLGAPRSQPASLLVWMASHISSIWVIKPTALPPKPLPAFLIGLANERSSNSSGHKRVTVWDSAAAASDAICVSSLDRATSLLTSFRALRFRLSVLTITGLYFQGVAFVVLPRCSRVCANRLETRSFG